MHMLKDVMTRNVEVISPEATIAEAAQRMRQGDFGLLPVGENDRMIGTITDRDIAVRAVAEGKGCDTKVREVMSDGVCWAFEDESVEHAGKIMSDRQIRRLPIVDRDKRLTGIVSLGDLAAGRKDIECAAEALAEISEPA
jgi:CBS domain-containing protein